MEKYEINNKCAYLMGEHLKHTEEYHDILAKLISTEGCALIRKIFKHIVACIEKIDEPIDDYIKKIIVARGERFTDPISEKSIDEIIKMLKFNASVEIVRTYKGALELAMEDIDNIIIKVKTNDKAANDPK